MRRALGLQEGSAQRPQPSVPTPAPNGLHRPPRRFVRDGEVPVSVIHRDETSGTNQLEAARQTIRSLTAAKEHAERLLTEAQAAVRDLQTKFGHERLARDEAVQRAEAEKQAVEQALALLRIELAAESDARQRIEERLAAVLQERDEAEQRLQDMVAVQSVQRATTITPTGRAGRKASQTPKVTEAGGRKKMKTKPVKSIAKQVTAKAKPIDPGQQPRRRGRPPKVKQAGSEFVEWWKPGWKDQLG